jgi:hypothetical protein
MASISQCLRSTRVDMIDWLKGSGIFYCNLKLKNVRQANYSWGIGKLEKSIMLLLNKYKSSC